MAPMKLLSEEGLHRQNSLFLYSFQAVTTRLLLSIGTVPLLTGKEVCVYICVHLNYDFSDSDISVT